MARPDDDLNFDDLARQRGQRRPPRREDDEDDDRPRRRRKSDPLSGVIPYGNVMALAAYYCAFASLIGILGTITLVKAMRGQDLPSGVVMLGFALGGLLAPLAVVLGILGLMHVTKHPEAKGTAHAMTGIVLGTAEIVGLLIIVFAKVIVLA